MILERLTTIKSTGPPWRRSFALTDFATLRQRTPLRGTIPDRHHTVVGPVRAEPTATAPPRPLTRKWLGKIRPWVEIFGL